MHTGSALEPPRVRPRYRCRRLAHRIVLRLTIARWLLVTTGVVVSPKIVSTLSSICDFGDYLRDYCGLRRLWSLSRRSRHEGASQT